MRLEDLDVYQLSLEAGEQVWSLVDSWAPFDRQTLGWQLVRAVDSVAANLSEGFGRYHFGERLQFAYYARGSLYETKTWLTKAQHRALISPEAFDQLTTLLNTLAIKLNNYLRALNANRSRRPPPASAASK